MSDSKRTVLITGCSDGGLGAALAVAFHNAGLHVYATARDVSKMKHLESLGIETLKLDVLSDDSISSCVSKLSHLDILVNNAGAQLVMPLSDLSISAAKNLFDLNVWSYIAMSQAFLPLLLKSANPMIVHHTSSGSVIALPFQGTYNASKAAMAMFSDSQRLELESFGIKVVELKSGLVKSNIIQNHRETTKPGLPKGSIYEPAKEIMENSILVQSGFADGGETAERWAGGVVQDLLKSKPPKVIWRGESAWMIWLASCLPAKWFEGSIKKVSKWDEVDKALRKA